MKEKINKTVQKDLSYIDINEIDEMWTYILFSLIESAYLLTYSIYFKDTVQFWIFLAR